jgi:hypothetical protein
MSSASTAFVSAVSKAGFSEAVAFMREAWCT